MFGVALPAAFAPLTASTVQAHGLTGDVALDQTGKSVPTPSAIFGPPPVVLPALTAPQSSSPSAQPQAGQSGSNQSTSEPAPAVVLSVPSVLQAPAPAQNILPQAQDNTAPQTSQTAQQTQPAPQTQAAPANQNNQPARTNRPAQTAPANPFPTHQAFLDAVGAAARTAQAQTGVPASVTVAQAILESNWGNSLLSREANNYFGLKAVGNQPSVTMPTTEVDSDGVASTVQAAFRAYPSMVDSLVDHDNLFLRLQRYAPAMAARNNPQQFAQLIAAGGYATDPAYPQKLIDLMNTYNLYQYDLPASNH